MSLISLFIFLKYILNKKITIIIWEKSKRQPCGYSQLLSRAEFVFAIAPLMDLASYWSTKTQSSIIKSQNDHPLASWCSTKFEGRNKKKSKQLLIVVLLAGLFKNNVLNHNFEDLFLTKQKSIKAWFFSIKHLNFFNSL